MIENFNKNIIQYILKFNNFCLIGVKLRRKYLFTNQPLVKKIDAQTLYQAGT